MLEPHQNPSLYIPEILAGVMNPYLEPAYTEIAAEFTQFPEVVEVIPLGSARGKWISRALFGDIVPENLEDASALTLSTDIDLGVVIDVAPDKNIALLTNLHKIYRKISTRYGYAPCALCNPLNGIVNLQDPEGTFSLLLKSTYIPHSSDGDPKLCATLIYYSKYKEQMVESLKAQANVRNITRGRRDVINENAREAIFKSGALSYKHFLVGSEPITTNPKIKIFMDAYNDQLQTQIAPFELV